MNSKENSTTKKGISLIVLVITIIVIIILASAVMLSLSQNNPIQSATEAMFKQNLGEYKSELSLYITSEYAKNNGNFDPTTINKTGSDIKTVITSIKDDDTSKFVIKNSELIYTGIDKTELQSASDLGAITVANKPVLAQGMTPIKWDTDGNIVTTTESDSDWYNYNQQKWANAETADGSMWVWIPRYEYKIDNPHTSRAQTIHINFIQGTNTTADSGYIMHPAFTFGDTELTGIWVAKFEATAREGLSNTLAGDNVTNKHVKILPNVQSWRNIIISNMFDVCRNMETDSEYGWNINGNGVDTHLIKNTEWGAVSYLTNSVYGKNSAVKDSSSADFYTGDGNNNGYISNIDESTTGTIYGIYGMSGNKEYVSAYINNNNTNLSTNGLSLINASDKYKNVYVNGISGSASENYSLNSSKVGDAIYETSSSGDGTNSSWYLKLSVMPCSDAPFFKRIGLFGLSNGDGIDFSNRNTEFRPVLLVDESL